MNWYKYSKINFSDDVQFSTIGKNHLTLWIHGKKYQYYNIENNTIQNIKNQLNQIKKQKNKNTSGSKLSYLIKDIEKFRK